MSSDDGVPQPPANQEAADRPRRLDAMAVGRSILAGVRTAPPADVPGYQILGFAGQGGLGQVWHAARKADGRSVALKLTAESDPELEERLAAEAATLKALQHPHIVELLDFTGTAKGQPVLVMEWVDGPNLARHLPDKGFDFDHALQIYLPVVDAVGYAHGQGIIHRDLKPSNILLTAAGVPKVSDFGLARSVHQRRVAFSMTRSGAVAGTVEYLAPECYRPDYQPSAAADIYALGVLLYEMLTGTPPRGAWLPLSQIKSLDVRLDALIADLIHPDPDKRPASASAVRERLEEIRGTRPRLSGTPLASPAVRLADLGWTVLGLYVCVAAFCATLSQTRTPVPALFDLRFGARSLLLAGFLAVWFLSLCIGALSFWQIIRLWRFRHVPLREALPQPFGARLGRGTLTAWLVGLAQFMISALPPLFTLTVVFHALHWWSPETPAWQRSLVVTPWMTDQPVSVWHWDPSGFFDGGKYWLKEADAGFVPGRLRVADKTSFFVCIQPGLMVLAAVVTGVCWLLTFVMAVRQWWPARRRAVLALAGGGLLLVAAGVPLWHYDATRSQRERRNQKFVTLSHNLRVAYLAEKFTGNLLESLVLHRADPPDAATLTAGLREPLEWLDAGPLTQSGLLAWAAADRSASVRERRIIENLVPGNAVESPKVKWPAEFLVNHGFLEYRHPGSGRVEAGFRHITWAGKFRRPDKITVTRVRGTQVPVYHAEPRGIPPAEAESWLESFLTALSAPGSEGIEAYFNEKQISLRPFRIQPAEEIISVLRAERNRWKSLRFNPAEPLPRAVALTGARWQLTPRLHQSGIRQDGAAAGKIPFNPVIDLVWSGTDWRIVGLSF